MRRLTLLCLCSTLLACEELPPGELDRVWSDALDVDAVLDALPDTLEDDGIDASEPLAPPDRDPLDAAPIDLAPPPDRDPPPPLCALDDLDGDGYGTDPGCPTPDCDDGNRSIHPHGVEACNGLDDDCDGAIDEALHTAICGVGACRREHPNCVDGVTTRCTPGPAAPETCNSIDDDCDGAIDEGAPTAACGVGACARQAACVDGVERACEAGPASDEICNRQDDDCDGLADEGFGAAVVQTAYSVLVERHPNCDGGGERIGPNCNAAMSRFCAARDCAVAGFGPVENFADNAWVTCLANAERRGVAFAELAMHHGPCDGQTQRIGPDCNAAIHRWCRSQGFASGFGPLESGAADVTVACVREAVEVRGVAYAELATHHEPCNGQRQRIGPDCNAAIHRWCRSQGFESGYGPVENSGGDAQVTCVRR